MTPRVPGAMNDAFISLGGMNDAFIASGSLA